MKYIQLEEVKTIQMDILDTVQMYCEKKNITYSIACGTMLGAIRHKGYIPWDDDIDIYMMRCDYDRFISEFPEVFKNIEVASLERDPLWTRAYAQAYNDKTVLIDGPAKYQTGVGIDIFPIDYVPEEESAWQRFNLRRKFLQNLYDMKLIEFSKERKLLKNIILVFFMVLLSPVSLRQIGKMIDCHARKYQYHKTNYVFENSQGSGLKKRFNADLFNEIIDLPFENRTFKGFANYDNYLSNSYGDYMQLPPVDKRVSHHEFKAWWKE